MTPKQAYKIIGIAPINDYSKLKNAYLAQLKRISKGENAKKIELNQAFNSFSNENIQEMYLLARAHAESEVGSYTNNTPEIINLKKQIESLDTKWLSMEADDIIETVTLQAFLEGSMLLLDNGEQMKIPPRFLGVLSRMKESMIQLVFVKPKSSVLFNFTAYGDLILKDTGNDSQIVDNHLKMGFKTHKFDFDLSKLKRKSNNSSIFVAKGEGLVAWGALEAGDLIIDIKDLQLKSNNSTCKYLLDNVLL